MRNFIARYIIGHESKWLWFGVILFGSFIPALFRFILSWDTKVHAFDIKDILFAGIAINLANLPLMANKPFDLKIPVAISSVIFLIFISFFLGIFLLNEVSDKPNHFVGLNILSTILVTSSLCVSFLVNKYLF